MTTHDWTHVHLQQDLINDYVAHDGHGVDRRLEGRLREEFPTHDDLLRAVHQRWVTVLDACVDQELEMGEGGPMDTFRSAWHNAIDRAPGLRRVLDQQADNPVLHQLEDVEMARVAQACGLWRSGVSVADLIASARAGVVAMSATPIPRQRSRVRRWLSSTSSSTLHLTHDGYPVRSGSHV